MDQIGKVKNNHDQQEQIKWLVGTFDYRHFEQIKKQLEKSFDD